MGEHDELMKLPILKEHEAGIVKAALEVAQGAVDEVFGPHAVKDDNIVRLGIAIYEHWNTGR